jgi:hypothetical protein
MQLLSNLDANIVLFIVVLVFVVLLVVFVLVVFEAIKGIGFIKSNVDCSDTEFLRYLTLDSTKFRESSRIESVIKKENFILYVFYTNIIYYY